MNEYEGRLSPIKFNTYKPLSEIVSDAIREAIRTGALAPRERLMEIHLANRLGVSRTPIREAIRRLEQEGFVVMIPRRGAYVADMSMKDISQVFEVRTALEELAAGLAAQRISKEEVEEKLSKNDIVFFIADINGAFSVRKHYPKETLIVYLDTTIEDMKKHMKMRGDSDESIERRINFAVNSKELENGKFADIIINNGSLDECRIQFSKIILALRMGNL